MVEPIVQWQEAECHIRAIPEQLAREMTSYVYTKLIIAIHNGLHPKTALDALFVVKILQIAFEDTRTLRQLIARESILWPEID
jgi:hypothetical protein